MCEIWWVTEGPRPYRPRPRRVLAPYAAAWREYAWRVRTAYLLFAIWLGLLIVLAVRLRTWVIFVMFPAPFKAWCLKGFACPRCDQPFAVSRERSWWGAGRVEQCVHCGLDKGALADPDG